MVGTLLLVPYATIHLEYRLALRLQAIGLLATLLLAGALTLTGRQPAAGKVRPGNPLRLALLVYLAAMALGTVVALVLGNSSTALAGQLLSLAFLPLAAIVGWRLGKGRWSLLVLTLPLATVVAVLFHLVRWLIDVVQGKTVLRLFFDNTVSVSEIAPMALLLALAGAASPQRWQRAVALASVPLLCLYIVGAATRGVWLITIPAVLIYWFLAGLRHPRSRRALWVLVGLTAFAGAVVGAIHHKLSRPTHRLMSPRYLDNQQPEWSKTAGKTLVRAGHPPRPITSRVPLAGPGAYRLSAQFRGGRSGIAIIAMRLLNDDGKRIGSMRLLADPSTRWKRVESIASIPPATESAQVWLFTGEGAEGGWKIDDLHIDRLSGSWATPLLAQGAHLGRRLRSIAELLSGSGDSADHALHFRFEESRELLRRVRDATPTRKLLGHGLGARFSLPKVAPAAKRTGPRGAPQNYIHNYYLFLLYKLGFLGTALILLSFILVVACALRATVSSSPGPRRAFLAAATAALVAYSVLALASPVFLDFRLTPFWGLLSAAIAGAMLETAENGDETS